MKHFYIIRFLKKPIVKIGISQNLENRIRQHYFNYQEFELDLENIEVLCGDSAKIRLLETYIKCKFDHLDLDVTGYTELFSLDDEPKIIKTIGRLCADLVLDDLKLYIPTFESKSTNSTIPSYEYDTQAKIKLFASLYNEHKEFVRSIRLDTQDKITIEFNLEGMEVDAIRNLYNYALNIEYTVHKGLESSNLIISRRLFHKHQYDSFHPELVQNGFYFGVVDKADRENAIESAYKLQLELKLNPLLEYYPETWSLLPNELKLNTTVNQLDYS